MLDRIADFSTMRTEQKTNIDLDDDEKGQAGKDRLLINQFLDNTKEVQATI